MNTHPSGSSFPTDPAADFGLASHAPDPLGQSPYDTYGTGDTNGYYAADYAQYPGAAYDSGAYPGMDPLSGAMPGGQGEMHPVDPYADPYGTGSYGTDPYGSDPYGMTAHSPYGSDGYTAYPAYGTDGYGTEGYGTDGYGTTWDNSGYATGYPDVSDPFEAAIPRQYAPADAGIDPSALAANSGHWAQGEPWGQGEHGEQWHTGGYVTSDWDAGAYADTSQGQGYWYGDGYGVAGADAAAYGLSQEAPYGQYDAYGHYAVPEEQQSWPQQMPEQHPGLTPEQGQYAQPEGMPPRYVADTEPYEGPAFHLQETASYEPYVPQDPQDPQDPHEAHEAHTPHAAYEPYGGSEAEPDSPDVTSGLRSEADPEPGAATVPPTTECRSRRRSPKRRSALMTVAAPSVAVLGVAGIAAASVSGSGSPDEGGTDTTTAQAAAPDTQSVEPSPANNKLDTQLAGLSEDADDFADRASRTQERIDLEKRKEAERERKAAEAARKEAMRPKVVAPVSGVGLSAQYGQAGVNWMSLHSGIDFPVSFGSPVKAATDGTVTTKYDVSFGNMVIVTAEDGTETWYCHLSSTKIRSGTVQAGDVIAYSGNSGNSTGPHLHFEVHPGGGEAIDPIPWFRSKGVELG